MTLRPGPCSIPDPYKPWPEWTKAEHEAYERWQLASHDYWVEIADEFKKVFPSQIGLAFEQPGFVIYADYEDRSYAWLGSTDEPNGDGPWAHGDAEWVGGYRYAPDSYAEIFTERVLVEVPFSERDWPEAVANRLAMAARKLGELEFTESV